MQEWCTGDRVQVAEYWYVETVAKTITTPSGKTRVVYVDKVHSCLIDGMQILPGTETEWPGSTIPIACVTGRVQIIDGKPRVFSLIRFSRDAQHVVNVSKSRIAETLGLSPISPWIAEAGQIEEFANEWMVAHKRPLAVLRYRGVNVGNEQAPPPQRQVWEPPINALTNFVLQEIQDIKESTSIYDPSLGDKSNETSGIAIRRRQQQSSLTNFHFIDNLARAHRFGGRIIAEVVPVIYDTERQIRIIGEDEQQRIIKVNTLWQDPETGKTHAYNLTTGKYDVTVTTGPGYTTKRQEAFELLTQLSQAYPDLVAVGGDVIFQNSDIPGADALAKRFKKRIPPELLEDDDEQAPQLPPAAKAQMAAMDQAIAQLTEALNLANEDLKGKRMDIESRERIEAEKLELEREKMVMQYNLEQMKLGDANAQFEMKAQLELVKNELAAMRSRELAEVNNEHQAGMAMLQNEHQAGMADLQHQQNIESKGMDQSHQMTMSEMQAQRQAEAAKQQSSAERPEAA